MPIMASAHFIYFIAESEARRAKRGLWQDTEPIIPPWDYRRATREKNPVSIS